MRNFVFVLIWLLSVSLVAIADEAVPDLSGIWELETWSTEGWPTDPPYTDAGRAAQDAWAAAPENDPSNRCLIPLGRIISAPMPYEIIQQERRLTFLYEYEHQVRRVFMDGRPHPADAYPTLMGHSIGKWDNGTLIVETIGVENGGLFRPQGIPYTADLHLTERYTLVDDGSRIIVEFVIEDRNFFSEPWAVKKRYRRSDTEILDYECIVRPHMPGVN
jgi:hypothetical protein